MSILDFTCIKCGKCCRNLLVEDWGITNGLELTDKEIDLSDPKFVKPHMGLGNLKTVNIISYQLNLAVCPYIDEKNNCKIYNRRPLVCQSYPVEVTPMGSIIREDCPQSFSIPRDGTALTESGLIFNQYVLKKFDQFNAKDSLLWVFDLSSDKWTIVPDPFFRCCNKKDTQKIAPTTSQFFDFLAIWRYC